jgi:hypothetical protein
MGRGRSMGDDWDQAARFVHRCQVAWLDLVATGQDAEAVVMGQVVEALFDDDPRLAILRAEAHGLPPSVISAIRTAFHLTG